MFKKQTKNCLYLGDRTGKKNFHAFSYLLSVLVIIEESANNFSVYELTVLWQHT
jgi:hypothetical protein